MSAEMKSGVAYPKVQPRNTSEEKLKTAEAVQSLSRMRLDVVTSRTQATRIKGQQPAQYSQFTSN
jgi:hypothetical protein